VVSDSKGTAVRVHTGDEVWILIVAGRPFCRGELVLPRRSFLDFDCSGWFVFIFPYIGCESWGCIAFKSYRMVVKYSLEHGN